MTHHTRVPLRLSTLVLAILSTTVLGEGYGLASANRDNLKTEAWQCKRCVSNTGTHGTIGVGVAHNDGEDSHFGNTSGTDKDGVVASLEGDIRHRAASGYQTHFTADKLGYDNGFAQLTTGKPGQYNISAAYRAIAHYDTNQALTPYHIQADAWQLPQQWQTGATTAQMTDLQSSIQPTSLQVERDRYNLDASYIGSFYRAELGYQYEQRQGHRRASGNLLTNSTMLTERIDDATDNVTAKIYLNGTNWLAGIETQLSHYKNDQQALRWQSAFTPTFGAAYSGQNAVSPDNKAYRIAGNTQLSSGTQHVLMHIGFTRMTQDQSYLPATINGPSPVLPTDNLAGQVDITEMKLNYSGRVSRALSLRASYDYRDRDNKTQVDRYPQIITDSYLSGYAHNLEYDRTAQQAKLAAKYRLNRAAYIDIGYDYDHNNYSDLDRQSLQESTLFAKIHYRISTQWQVWLKASGSDRTGSEYSPVSTTVSPSNPLLRKSYLADRERQRYGLYGSYATGAFSASANAHWMQDDYTDTLIGLTKVDTQGYDLSAQYAVNDNINLNAFVNQDWRDSDQAGSSNFGAPNWYATSAAKSTLIGAGLDYANLLDNKLKLGIDYTYADGQNDTEVIQGLRSPYDSYYSTRHTLNTFANYQISDKFGLRFDWIFEQYQDADWANEGLAPNSIPNVLSFGDLSHDYNAHYFGLTLSYQL